MSITKGTTVRVVSDSSVHRFPEGTIATYTGEDFQPHPAGQWRRFDAGNGHTQWLLEEHYEVIEQPKTVKVTTITTEKSVTTITEEVNLPSKVVYVVTKQNGDISYTGDDREIAREVKAALGGKRNGVVIYQYAAVKEIR